MNQIIQHMITDPNALKHADAGLYTFMLSVLAFIILMINPLYALVMPFVTGVGIEVYQRIERAIKHKTQNTIKESVLDVMQTGLFYVTYWVRKGL